MTSIKPRLLKGFRDYLPDQMILRSRAMQTIRGVFESFGFVPLDTPTLEYAEILLGKYGDDAEKLLYKFADNGGREVCMRYDLTVPLARVVAQYPDLQKPFKRYQMAPVWRGENTGKGRYREFVQCDVDIVGTKSLLADFECIWVGHNVMKALGVERFRIHVSHRKLLEGLSTLLGDGLTQRQVLDVFRTVDKLPSQGRERVESLLAEEVGLDARQIATVFGFLDISGEIEDVLARLDTLFAEVPLAREGIADLRQIFSHARSAGLDMSRLGLDLTIARGLDYYTGAVFETFLEDLPSLGSVMSGGRYDGLIGFFAKQDIPAVGISVGLDRLFSGMEELGVMKPQTATAEVLVTIFDAALTPRCLELASRLRSAGINAELYYQADSLGKQLQFADRRGIPLALIVGENEVAQGVVGLKVLAEKRQETVPLDQLEARLKALIAGT
ncbi:MAG: histidine--tRNA ligase [Proteobacteria bacterium]|nr:histidine--tRNA ligase [Pseudomonadota bacterium]